MISTTILSLSSSSTAELVSLAATSVTGDSNGAGGGGGGGELAVVVVGRGRGGVEGDGGAWEGLWLVFLPLWLLVSMETAWAWHSRFVAAAASARWGLASSGLVETGGDA